MSQPIHRPSTVARPHVRRAWLWLVVAGAAMILAGVLLWNFGDGMAIALLMFALFLFGGLSMLAGVVVLAIRRR